MAPKVLRIVDYDPEWTSRFDAHATRLRAALGSAALRIDHIGSTSVPYLAAKDVIDVQVTVGDLADADDWPDELLPGLRKRPQNDRDHVPPGAVADHGWDKRMWSERGALHVHVRADGAPNQVYPLLFRDYLRADRAAASAYAALKCALVEHAPDDWDTYYAIKDPACDVIIAAARQWASRVGWKLGPSDA